VEHNLAIESDLKQIEKKIQSLIEDAVSFAQESPEPDSSELYRFIFAEDE
jgi:pyruvate dehydrogenase E1 component alpha subunit